LANQTDITELIDRVALRDRAAFDTLYAATSAKLLGVLLRILRDRSEAEDALQDVYIRIWHRADRFRSGGGSAMSWLIAIARNHAIDKLRARKPVAEDIDVASAIAGSDPTPEAAAVAGSERAALEACLEELEANKADAVKAAYMEGFSYAELAERNAVPLNTMRTWLRRSLQKLKACLENG
jgi:RNA polymerase sigma-70 factor (ECF subfamily)